MTMIHRHGGVAWPGAEWEGPTATEDTLRWMGMIVLVGTSLASLTALYRATAWLLG